MSEISLNQIDLDSLRIYLTDQGWFAPEEELLSFEPAGAGNMNLTYRLTTDRRSIILKQSLPWVAKYPQIPAPVGRIETEVAFYRHLAPEKSLTTRMPRLLAVDTENHLAVLSDLSPAKDLSRAYARPASLSTTHAAAAGQWLALLHNLPQPAIWSDHLQNKAMRELNYAHLFVIPFSSSMPFSLDDFTPGLEDIAKTIRTDDGLREKIITLGERHYLSDGPILLHGDFFPGSLMAASNELFVIDPEFCYPGPPEFDLAVFLAHTRLAGLTLEVESAFLAAYAETGPSIRQDLINALASVEILRRLIGVAQLPLRLGLTEKRQLIEAAAKALVNSLG